MSQAVGQIPPHKPEHDREFKEDAARTLARYALQLKFEQLPPAVVDLTKLCILDAMGTTLAATTLAPEAPMFHAYVREVGGHPECTLFGYGEKAPAQMAAFLNGSNSHMLDYDDVGSGHVSVSTVSVAWAMAEKAGKPVSGRELLTAVAVGIDIHTRIYPYESTEEWDLRQPWSATQCFGYLSGAALASRLLGLSEEQAGNAMSLGYQQIAGASQRHLGMHAGWSSQGAVLAALLARQGIPGAKDILNGKAGMFHVYLNGEKPDLQRLTGDYGKRFRTLELHGFKAWPACGATRRPITAILELRKEHGLRPEDVKSIRVMGGEHLLRLSEPRDLKRRPPHSAQAKFALPFTCGVAMAHGDVKLENYTPQGLKDERTLAMADLVTVEVDHRPDRPADTASVEIITRSGQRLFKEVSHPLGDDRDNPMSREQIEAKFRNCATFSAKPIAKANVDKVVALMGKLEQVSDVREILEQLQ
jgi:2-methylcitrate dehydratase PrpD